MKYRELLFVTYTKVSVATGYNLNKFGSQKMFSQATFRFACGDCMKSMITCYDLHGPISLLGV